MGNVIVWIGLALLIAGLTFMNQKHLYSSTVKQAYRELRGLTDKIRTDRSEPSDLYRWEVELAEMEKHPSELNKLDAEIGLRQAFVLYLERHYPQDARLPSLKEAAGHQKDTVWGIKIGDYGSKN